MKMRKWDVCPNCGARRIVVCPYCNTIGDNFPLADLDLILPPEHAENVSGNYNAMNGAYDDGEENSVAVKSFLADSFGSAFGGGGVELQTEEPEGNGHQRECGRHGHSHCSHEMVKLTHPIEDAPEINENTEEYPLAVQCPCCDEVLYPTFLDVCGKCGYVFPDGVNEENVPNAHFYVPGEYDHLNDKNEDEDEDEDEDESGYSSAGCCVMILAVTAMSLAWKFFC